MIFDLSNVYALPVQSGKSPHRQGKHWRPFFHLSDCFYHFFLKLDYAPFTAWKTPSRSSGDTLSEAYFHDCRSGDECKRYLRLALQIQIATDFIVYDRTTNAVKTLTREICSNWPVMLATSSVVPLNRLPGLIQKTRLIRFHPHDYRWKWFRENGNWNNIKWNTLPSI